MRVSNCIGQHAFEQFGVARALVVQAVLVVLKQQEIPKIITAFFDRHIEKAGIRRNHRYGQIAEPVFGVKGLDHGLAIVTQMIEIACRCAAKPQRGQQKIEIEKGWKPGSHPLPIKYSPKILILVIYDIDIGKIAMLNHAPISGVSYGRLGIRVWQV